MVSNKQTLPPVILMMGPTAAGKTDAAIQLAQQFPVELISVDSALIYKDMDIGTAKPSAEELAQAPHRLIDFLDPAQPYSAAKFCTDARQHIDEIHASHHIPLLVGGTMMYFNRLVEGMSDLPDAAPEIRAEIELRAEQIGWEAIHAELAAVDPKTAARVHPNDPQRIQRALEVHRITGQPMSALTEQRFDQLEHPQLRLAISPANRKVLHERIAVRFRAMVENGLIEEVERLYQRGDLTLNHPSIRAVGYRQVWLYLQGEIDREQMIHQGIVATRRLAKRQLTWLRGMDEINWLDPTDPKFHETLTSLVIDFLNKYNKS